MEQGFDGRTVRYWLMATHYRTVLHYSLRERHRAAQCVARLNEFAARLARYQSGRRSADVGRALHETQAAWRDAMDNDLNVPKALGKLFPFVRQVNRLLDREELDGDQVGQILDFMRQVNDVLNVVDFQPKEPNAQVAKLIAAREKARRAKDFDAADTIRKELESIGVHVADSSVGTS
jgi:cysteinyl-tRNA synthetase